MTTNATIPSAAPAPASSPAASPAPATPTARKDQGPAIRRLNGASPRAYETRPSSLSKPVAPAAAKPGPAQMAAPTVVTPPASTSAKPTADVAPPPPSGEALAVDSAPEEPAESAPADPPEADPAEVSKRLARIAKQEAKARAAIQAERAKLDADRATHAENARRVSLFEQAMAKARQDPLAVLNMLGVAPQAVIDAILGADARAKDPAAQLESRLQAQMQQRLDEYKKQLDADAKAQQARTQEQQIAAYKAQTLAPFIESNAAKFPLLVREHGPDAANQVFAYQQARYRLTKGQETPTPEQACAVFEKHYQDQLARLTGATVAPGKAPQNGTRNAAAKDSTAPQTPNQPRKASPWATVDKPMIVKVKT